MPNKRITVTLSEAQQDHLAVIAAQFFKGDRKLGDAGKMRLAIAVAFNVAKQRLEIEVQDTMQHGGKRKGAGRKR